MVWGKYGRQTGIGMGMRPQDQAAGRSHGQEKKKEKKRRSKATHRKFFVCDGTAHFQAHDMQTGRGEQSAWTDSGPGGRSPRRTDRLPTGLILGRVLEQVDQEKLRRLRLLHRQAK